jgi:outer membrane protein TolC
MRLGTISAVALISAFTAGCAVEPDPFTSQQSLEMAKSAYGRMTAGQEPLSGTIDVYEAMARALKYNLDHRVEEMNDAIRIKELDLAHYSMLPSLVGNTAFSARNNENASNSFNILTGEQSLPFSTSQQEKSKTSDISFSWNILDFGLSYVRAQQAADRYLISDELRRKAVARIIEDVRSSFWRAVSADRLIGRLSHLESRIRTAQSNARASAVERQTSPLAAVTYERELVEIKRAILELQRDLAVARTQLSALMNVEPGSSYRLASEAGGRVPKLTMTVPEMIATALQNRPELKQIWYERRINDRELDAALFDLLPGFAPFAGTNYDSNDYLYNHHWLSWGAKASWNVMKAISYPAHREVIESQDKQLDVRGLAMTMAVITQIHVSRIRYLQSSRELATAREFLDVQHKLVGLIRTEASADRISEQTLIREEMNTLLAEAKRDIAYAAVQNAFANIYSSVGLDPYSHELDQASDVKTLAQKLRGMWIERGDAERSHRS